MAEEIAQERRRTIRIEITSDVGGQGIRLSNMRLSLE